MAGVINPADVVFGRGFIMGTPSGAASDSLPFGEVRGATITIAQDIVELEGAASLAPVGVGIKNQSVRVQVQYAKIRARQLTTLFGAAAAFSSPKTTVTKGINANPSPFNLHLIADGSSAISATTDKFFEVNLLSCVAESLEIVNNLGEFVIISFTARVYGNGTDHWQVIMAGDQTTS